MGNMIKIDKDKLRNEIQRRGISLVEASVAIGAKRNYLSSALYTGTMNMIVVNALKLQYNINPEDIIYKEEPEEPEKLEEVTSKPQQDVPVISTNELYQIIYSAVYQAVKTALNE